MKPDRYLLERQLARWLDLFTSLAVGGVPGREQLEGLVLEAVHFSDPFNDIQGIDRLQRLFEHTHRQVEGVRFEVHDTAWSDKIAYVRWSMTGRVRVIGDWHVTGISEIRFANDGRIAEHIDHWDAAAQFYARLPVIGWLLRQIAARAVVY